ncbi:MAG: flagellar export protein FliJ [Sulfurimonas sp.]|nr:flagellar export protein FliJ [Sulfurimonas sp.]
MKTRFSSLVKLKKSTMRKSEQLVQQTNANLNNASTALELSYSSLEDVNPPSSGTMKEMLASRTLLESQRGVIQHNKEWVNFANNQVNQAKNQLKLDMIEYEKFNYLELQEIKKEIKKRKVKEAKDLDEIALMTYKGKDIL